MKSALYWKILLGFAFTFIVIQQGSWLVYMMYSQPTPTNERAIAERLGPVQLAAARAVLEQGGLAALERLRTAWPTGDAGPLKVAVPSTPTPDPDILVAQASGPAGQHWQITYQLPRGRANHWTRSDLFYIPRELMVLGALGGLIFSAVLASYLTRPVQRICGGFDRLARGDLDTRLRASMGKRRDEIADLANDFDRMAARLQQLVAGRDQLLHDVSHELRSPLARLNQAIALVRQDPAHTASCLERIEMEIRRLDELVGELLSLARSESGEMARDRYFDLPHLTQAVVSNATFEATSRGVHVDLRTLCRDEGIVRGNAELMRRALENVVRNAVRFSRHGQKIEVMLMADPERDHFIVTVADEGPGVPAGKLDEIFNPFVRLGESPCAEGYGLGLAIARRAIVALGGTIEAHNRAPRGLAVSLSVPIHSALTGND